MNQGAERHPAQDPVGFVADGGEMGERTCALDGSKTAQAACQAAAAALSQNPHDLPFVLLYQLDAAGGEARLAGWTGLEPGTAASPAGVALTDTDTARPFRQVAQAGRPVQVHDLSGTSGPLPGGAWPESPQRAVVLPMGKPGQFQLAGFVAAGVSPRLAFTEEYQGYLDLVARHIADAVANARACLEEALGGLPDTAEAVPVMPDALPAAPERVSLPYLPAEQGEAGRPRVLLADDNADMRRHLLRLLTERFRVEAVADGEAALAAARERRPDLILADVMMPGLDGLALLGAVRADPQLRELPVILVSARADEEGRTEGMAAGADDYLVEPFDARELLVRVGAQLQMARLRQDANEALRRSEERFRQLADAMPQIVWTAAGDGRIEYYNRRVDEFDALRPNADGTWEWPAVLHPDDRERTAAAWQAALATGRPDQCEHRARMDDGTYRWYLSRAEPAADERGRAIRWYGTGTDIHDRKQTEEALHEADWRKDRNLLIPWMRRFA